MIFFLFSFFFFKWEDLSLSVLLECVNDLCLIILFKMKYLGLIFFLTLILYPY